MDRVLGIREADAAGPTVVGIGGLHGNETAGVRAVESILDELGIPGSGLRRGRFVALAGNIAALRSGVRYIDYDLNRAWSNGGPRTGGGSASAEGTEQRKLAAALQQIREESRGPVHVVDLHTVSGEGPPFVVMGDTPANQAFAQALPVPLVLGLGGRVQGTLIEHLDEGGWVNLTFEAGPHDDPASSSRAEHALWILLGAAGLLDPSDPRVAEARRSLSRVAEGLPRVVRVFHVHPLTSAEAFEMRPGYQSFQEVRKGELLALDNGREIRAPRDGRILMPLYQDRGGEGFFLTDIVHPTWLRTVTARGARAERPASWHQAAQGSARRRPDAPPMLPNPRGETPG